MYKETSGKKKGHPFGCPFISLLIPVGTDADEDGDQQQGGDAYHDAGFLLFRL